MTEPAGLRSAPPSGDDRLTVPRCHRLVPLLLVALLGIASRLPASAEDEPTPTVAERRALLVQAADLSARVDSLQRQERFDEALELARETLAIRQRLLSATHPLVATSLDALGTALMRAGRAAEARPYYEDALARRTKRFGPDHLTTAVSLVRLGVLLHKLGLPREAEPLIERVVAIREARFGPDHDLVAAALTLLGVLHQATGRYDAGLEVLGRALAITEARYGPAHPNVGIGLNNIALLHVEAARYDRAASLYERALGVLLKALGPEHQATLQTRANLGETFVRLGRADEGRALLEETLAIRERTLGPEHPDVARNLGNLGGLHFDAGRHEQAETLYRRALALLEAHYGKEHPAVAVQVGNLAELMRGVGRYVDAEALYARALAIRRAALGDRHPDTALTWNNLGALHQTLGRTAEARRCAERALAVWEATYGSEHPQVATALNNIAERLLEEGRLEDARPLLERSLATMEQALGPMHEDVAAPLNNLARLLELAGQPDAARRLYERCLAILVAARGEAHPDVARTWNNLGHAAYHADDPEEALRCFRAAIHGYERALGRDHPSTALGWNNLATTLQRLGRHAEAREMHQKARASFEAAFGDSHPRVAMSLNNLAGLDVREGLFESARTLYERALALREAAYGPDHSEVAASLENLAELDVEVGHPAAADGPLRRALAIRAGNLQRDLAYLQVGERLARLAAVRRTLDRVVALAPDVERTGYGALLRVKGIAARATAAERLLLRAGGVEVQVALRGLRAAERRLVLLQGAMPPMFRKTEHAAWQMSWAEASAEHERLSRALARDVAPYRAALERVDFGLEDVRVHLGADEVLVDTLRAGGRYVAWLVPPAGPVMRFDLGPAETIEEAAAALDPKALDEAAWATAGRTLYDVTLGLVASALPESTRRIVLAPDAALATVPFAALPTDGEGRRVGERWTIAYVPMAQDLVPRSTGERGTGALLVGGVDYERADGEASAGRTPRRRTFAALAATAAEVEVLGDRWAGEASTLRGSGATESALSAATPGRRVLHLATHGFVDPAGTHGLRRRDDAWLGHALERQMLLGHDPLLRAGLALAGANVRDGGDGADGVLTAAEASYLDLDGVDLVVLSACETARGQVASGEGVLGLVQGFQLAGARQVLGSLWQVDDVATRALMERFHALIHPADGEGLPAAEALRRAQAHVRADEAWRHPYYWAAWVLWGR